MSEPPTVYVGRVRPPVPAPGECDYCRVRLSALPEAPVALADRRVVHRPCVGPATANAPTTELPMR